MSLQGARLRRILAAASAWALPGAVFAASALLAAWARHALVEHEQVAAACDAGQQGAACFVRGLVVASFQHQRLGYAAFALGLLALLSRHRGLSLAGLGAGGAGLLLYAAGPSAPAVLLAALGWLRASGEAPSKLVERGP